MTTTVKSIALLAAALAAGCGSGASNVQTRLSGVPFSESVAGVARAQAGTLSLDRGKDIEPVALFTGPMPTGVAVSRSGRIFVCFPRWGDAVAHTVAEVVGDQIKPYPDEKTTALTPDNPAGTFVSVQSVVVDSKDRLWVLDTGSINFGPPVAEGPKLICYDLSTNEKLHEYEFPADVVTKTGYLNDVRFDLSRGEQGTAYLTDSSENGGLIVLDLKSGHSYRRLTGSLFVRPEVSFVPKVEGRPLLKDNKPLALGSDGITLSPDGKTLYFCPLVGRRLYSVPTDALVDQKITETDLLQKVTDLGDKGFASDGLECDADGTLYLTDYEENAIKARSPAGAYSVLSSDPRMIWPDSISISSSATNLGDMIPPNGGRYLYFTANQLNRQPMFRGNDDRKQPYGLYRVRLDAR